MARRWLRHNLPAMLTTSANRKSASRSIGAAATERAENSVTIGRNSQEFAGARKPLRSPKRIVDETAKPAYTKKDRIECWKAAIGQSALEKAAWRCARICAAAVPLPSLS